MPRHDGQTAEHIGEAERLGAPRADRLGEHARQRGENGRRADDRDDETRAPAEPDLQHAAERRRHRRSDAHDAAHQRQLAPGARALIEIPHDGAGEDDGTGGAKPLGETRGDQLLDGERRRADRAGGDENAEAERQDRLAPVFIRQRPIEDLPRGVSDEKCRECELRLRVCRAQRARDIRQRGQIHVGRERPEHGHRRQRQRHRERAGLQAKAHSISPAPKRCRSAPCALSQASALSVSGDNLCVSFQKRWE